LENGFGAKVWMSVVMHEVSPRRRWIPDEELKNLGKSRLGGSWLVALHAATPHDASRRQTWMRMDVDEWMIALEGGRLSYQAVCFFLFFFNFLMASCSHIVPTIPKVGFPFQNKKLKKSWQKKTIEVTWFVCFFPEHKKHSTT
jgi:hypothetical protein